MTLEKIYKESIQLADMVEVLKESLVRHNPGIDSSDKIGLPFLAADCNTLIVRLGNMRTEILNIHERRQRDAADQPNR